MDIKLQTNNLRAQMTLLIKHFILNKFSAYYYKNVDLSLLENPCCPGFPTGNASPGQKVQPAPTWLAHPFVPVGVTNQDKRSLFFSCFSFLNSFSISIILLHFN